MNAYTLTDRAPGPTSRTGRTSSILVEGDAALFNQYGVILVNPAKFPHVKADLARRWHEWLTSTPGQKAIAGYQIDGQQVFFPNAERARAESFLHLKYREAV